MSMSREVPGSVVPAEPRTTAEVKLADGRIYEGPLWTELRHFVDAAGAEKPWPFPIVASIIDEELRELTYHIDRDVAVTPLGIDDRDGSRIYRRSLTFLLVVAVTELFPDVRINVDHSVTFGGYYCEVEGRGPFSAEELAAIEARMREIVVADTPIGKRRVPLAEAIDLFQRRGEDDKVQAAATPRQGLPRALRDARVRGRLPRLYGAIGRAAGHFALHAYPPGFILRFPPRTSLNWSPWSNTQSSSMSSASTVTRCGCLASRDVGALSTASKRGAPRKSCWSQRRYTSSDRARSRPRSRTRAAGCGWC